jgi:hypothetical protein
MTTNTSRMPDLLPYAPVTIRGFCGSDLHFWITMVFSSLPVAVRLCSGNNLKKTLQTSLFIDPDLYSHTLI